MSRRRKLARRHRTGMALVAALGLMVLTAGLLAGTAAVSLGLQRAVRTLAAAARAESELRRGLAVVLEKWDVGLDSMPVGAAIDRSPPPIVLDGASLTVRTRVRRLGSALYAATVAVQVGDSAAPLARRRARLVLTRAADSSAAVGERPVRPLAWWGVTELP